MPNRFSSTHISNELILLPCSRGIKLSHPESTTKTLASKTSVAEILELPINIYFLNAHSEMQRINETCASTMGFSSIKDSIGKTMFDISPADNANSVLATDRVVVSTKQSRMAEDTVIHLNPFNDQHFFTIKMPWYDHANNFSGIFGCSILFGTQPFAESLACIQKLGLLNINYPHQLLEGFYHQNIYFTKREKECLYYLIRGKSAREVAEKLNLSRRTVEQYIGTLKIKMNVSSKSELIEKVVDFLM